MPVLQTSILALSWPRLMPMALSTASPPSLACNVWLISQSVCTLALTRLTMRSLSWCRDFYAISTEVVKRQILLSGLFIKSKKHRVQVSPLITFQYSGNDLPVERETNTRTRYLKGMMYTWKVNESNIHHKNLNTGFESAVTHIDRQVYKHLVLNKDNIIFNVFNRFRCGWRFLLNKTPEIH